MTLERTVSHPDIRRLADSLRDAPGVPTSSAGIETWAAVALILRVVGSDPELLFIKRVEREGDSWSGQIALPGGREDADDGSLLKTAVRETWEEIGLDLAAIGESLGALDDVAPRTPVLPPIAVRPFVFAVPADIETRAGAEVAEIFWVGLDVLNDHSRWITAEVLARGEPLHVPAIQYGEHLIWGMTHRVIFQMAARLGAE